MSDFVAAAALSSRNANRLMFGSHVDLVLSMARRGCCRRRSQGTIKHVELEPLTVSQGRGHRRMLYQCAVPLTNIHGALGADATAPLVSTRVKGRVSEHDQVDQLARTPSS